MGAVDRQRIERGEDGSGIIVAGGAIDELAFTIARIVERHRPARGPEMLDLRPPDAFVRSDAVQEDDRRSAPRLLEMEADIILGDGIGHFRFLFLEPS